MLKNRLFISYFSTTLLYLFIAGIFFYMQNTIFVAAQKSEEQVICMALSTFVPEVAALVAEEKPVVEPEVVREPIREEEPEIEEEVIPEQVVITEKPKPVVREIKKKPKVKKKTQKKAVKKKKIVTKKQVSQKASAQKAKISPAQENKFLASIRAKIDKHKSYPRIAKKRGMQGSVKVNFIILSNGQVGKILVDGPKVFHTSAINAVKSAFPISVKEAPITLPKSINITLQYQMR